MPAFDDQLEDLIKRAEAVHRDAVALLNPAAKDACGLEIAKAVFSSQRTWLFLRDAKAKKVLP